MKRRSDEHQTIAKSPSPRIQMPTAAVRVTARSSHQVPRPCRCARGFQCSVECSRWSDMSIAMTVVVRSFGVKKVLHDEVSNSGSVDYTPSSLAPFQDQLYQGASRASQYLSRLFYFQGPSEQSFAGDWRSISPLSSLGVGVQQPPPFDPTVESCTRLYHPKDGCRTVFMLDPSRLSVLYPPGAVVEMVLYRVVPVQGGTLNDKADPDELFTPQRALAKRSVLWCTACLSYTFIRETEKCLSVRETARVR